MVMEQYELCKCTRVSLKAISVQLQGPQKDRFVLRYKMFSQHPVCPTGLVTIVLHQRAQGRLFARLYGESVCRLYRCPAVELFRRVNRGGTATQAFPSLSAALMMLCRTTAVSPWQVCRGATADCAGPDRRNAKNKTEGEETGRRARPRSEYPHRYAPRAPTKLDTGFN